MRRRRRFAMPAALRHADWRFLLPGSRDGVYGHLALLGAPEALADSLLRSGIARRVSREVPHDGGADALVVLSGARVSLDSAFRCLAPGGAFYLEIDRRRVNHLAWSAQRVERTLRRAGLTPTAAYWVLPSFEAAACYCPLGRPGALRWCLTALYPATGLLRRLIRFGAAAWLGRRRAETAPPGICFAVTGTAGPPSAPLPGPLGSALPDGRSMPEEIRPVMLTRGSDDFTRVILLPFAKDARAPDGVLKVGRFPERNSGTEAEQQVLGRIRDSLSAPWRDSVPEPRGLARWGALSLGWESCAPGRLLSTTPVGPGRAARGRLLQELESVTEWLVALHGSRAFPPETWGDAALQRWVEAPLTAYAECFGLTGSESDLFRLARARGDALRGVAIPIVWEHYDLGPWNVYRDGHRLCVIDWENSTPKLPLADLLYFVTHWSARARSVRGDEADLRHFQELFCRRDHPDPYLAAAHRAIGTYSSRLALDQRVYPLILLRLWVLHAVGLAARGRIAGGAAHASRAGNRFVQYVELLADTRLMMETS